MASEGAGSRDDELLDEIPDVHGGEFAGYRAGNRIRRWIIVGVVVTVLGATIAGIWYAKQQEAILRAGPGGTYELDGSADSVESRPRELVWSGGRARLGLSRAEPGISSIRLPDRIIRLANGYDHAQIKVDVRDGKTHRMDVLVGDVEVELLEGAEADQ